MSGRTTPCSEGCRHPECAALRDTLSAESDADAASGFLRSLRQARTLEWVRTTFGTACLTGQERAARLLEEVLELAQVEGLSLSAVGDLAAHVYGKPVGERAQELGGIGVTLLAYAATVGLSADAEEAKELARVRALPPDHFRKRQNVKADAGVAVRVDDDGLQCSHCGGVLTSRGCSKCGCDV